MNNLYLRHVSAIEVYIINIKTMYGMYSRQPRFLRLFLIFLLSARRTWNLKHFSKLPLLSNTFIVTSQSTTKFCPRVSRIISIQCSSSPSWSSIHDTLRCSIFCLRNALAILTSCSKSTFSSHVSTASHSRSSKLLLRETLGETIDGTDTGNDSLCSSLMIKQTP